MFPQPLIAFFETPNQEGTRTIEYFAQLIILNRGKAEVTAVGNIEPADNPYKRVGLTPNEAFHLTQLVSFTKGILFALGSPELEIEMIQYVLQEVERKQNQTTIYVPTGSEITQFGSQIVQPRKINA